MEVREKWKCEKNGSEKTKTQQQRVRKHPTQKPTKPPPHSRESGNLPIQRQRRESPAFGGHHREIPAFAGMGGVGEWGWGRNGECEKKWKCEKNGSVKKTEAKKQKHDNKESANTRKKTQHPPPHSRESGNLPIQRRRRESPAFGGHHREIPAFAGMGGGGREWGWGGNGDKGRE